MPNARGAHDGDRSATGGPGLPLWDRTSEEADIGPVAPGDLDTDVAIIGGGFTGLSTALHAAAAGVSCHVLEACRIGYGGSGRNVGLVNAGLWLPPRDVVARLGEARGARLLQALGAAPDCVWSLIGRHRIACEATRAGTIHAARSPAGFDDLARRAEAWTELGAPVVLLSRDAAAGKIGSGAFFGGLLDRRAGTVNPLAYARGLARAARAAGAGISVGAAARSLHRDGDRWVIGTGRGRVSARSVVLATNAYTDALWPGLARTFSTIRFFQAATAPLGERGRPILREGQGLWDTGRVMMSVRRDAAGRLIVGSMGRVTGVTRRWATRNVRRLFPDLGPVTFEAAWDGRIAMTPDHLPRVFRLAPDLYACLGYNGRGIAPGTVFGRALAELLAGGREEDLPLAVRAPETLRWAPVVSRLRGAACAVHQIARSF